MSQQFPRTSQRAARGSRRTAHAEGRGDAEQAHVAAWTARQQRRLEMQLAAGEEAATRSSQQYSALKAWLSKSATSTDPRLEEQRRRLEARLHREDEEFYGSHTGETTLARDSMTDFGSSETASLERWKLILEAWERSRLVQSQKTSSRVPEDHHLLLDSLH
mmetsp:Transcript_108406/g.191999  ORF Transcript_108406/g.191999 Transcript_108406/m.191999 type:complete len:162 (-) Transcript_108406:44-529(-)